MYNKIYKIIKNNEPETLQIKDPNRSTFDRSFAFPPRATILFRSLVLSYLKAEREKR